MSTSDNLASALMELAVDSCWRQWSALGAPLVPSSTGVARSIVDGEALVLATAFVMQQERRLADVMVNAAVTGSTFLSVKRLASLSRRYPEASSIGLGLYAETAVEAGDRRWKAHATSQSPSSRERFKGSQWPWTRALQRPTGLMLRLRAGVGHGTKADALTYLLGRAGAPATTKEIAEATQASTVALRVALKDMVMADFVRETGSRPSSYRAPPDRWRALLGEVAEESIAPWRDWAGVFAYLCNLIASMRRRSGESDFVIASAARDVYELHRDTLETPGLLMSNPDLHPGARYLKVLEHDLARLRPWFAEML